MTDNVHTGHPGHYKECTHPACLAHKRAYQKRWHYERTHGLLRTTDGEAATRHVNTLIGAGWSMRAIAGAAGVAPITVIRVRDGRPEIRKSIAAAILSVTVDQVPSKASKQTTQPFVPRVGTQRRIQALIFMGWPHHEISRRSGIKTAPLANQQGRWVTRATHDKIAAVYDELAMHLGPSPNSRGWARRFGYVGPLAWDDIDHDPAPNLDGYDEQEAS